MTRFLSFLLLLLVSLSALAVKPLTPDQAFTLSTKFFGEDTIVFTWEIAPDNYLYKDSLSFHITQPKEASIGTILMPAGKHYSNELLGDQEVYGNTVTIPVPLINFDPKETILTVNYQGCSKAGYCYPPITQTFHIDVEDNAITRIAQPSVVPESHHGPQNGQQEMPYISLLSDKHLASILLAFFGFGILLSFTPCVLPMLPILSGIILGHKESMSTAKGFWLSVTYALSMAITYAIIGMLVGFIGGSVQVIFQKDWILVLFSALFVLLALSYFGLYQIRLPQKLQDYLNNLSSKQKGGHYLGVAIMGCAATLIVSPCVTPALVGVLGYIAQTGNVLLGGAALFTMGLGMGLPLVIMGTASGKLLPKAGHWMQTLEICFGVLFLGMAIWVLDRILPSPVIMALYATLIIVSAVYLGAFRPAASRWDKLWKGLGLVFFIYGILLLIGVAQGNSNVFRPLENHAKHLSTQDQKSLFTRVHNLDELTEHLEAAAAQQKLVILDFYATWCVACKEMEQTTFRDPTVTKLLSSRFVTLQVDITKNSLEDKVLMAKFNVIAPPTLIFFGQDGQVLPDATLVGKISADALIEHLRKI